MKTHDELWSEATRLEAVGRLFAADYRRYHAAGNAFPPANYPPRVLAMLPESVVRSQPTAEFGANPAPMRIRRWIEVGMVDGLLEYRLFQSEISSTSPGGAMDETEPEFMVGSDSAFDVLEEGYSLLEKERIGEALIPFTESIADEESVRSLEPALVEEIEAIVGAVDLTPGERIRAKADIVAFLDGRMEPSEFISAAVERHGRREDARERIVEGYGERLMIGEP
jgi:hypothetical protein